MGFTMTSWKYLGQNYDRLHNKNSNNKTAKKVYNRNSLGKSLFRSGPPKKSVRNGNKIKGKHKMVFDKLKKRFIMKIIQIRFTTLIIQTYTRYIQLKMIVVRSLNAIMHFIGFWNKLRIPV